MKRLLLAAAVGLCLLFGTAPLQAWFDACPWRIPILRPPSEFDRAHSAPATDRHGDVRGRLRCLGSIRRIPAQPGMCSMTVVVVPTIGELHLQIRRCPEEGAVEVFAPNRADEAFNEWDATAVRTGC
jgi:hypothetical protein